MISLPIEDPSQVAEARRRAVDFAARQGFDEVDSGRVALVTTELATNVLKHAQRGEVLVGPYTDGSRGGMQIIALDNGAGIADIAASMSDGYSTAGTAGKGFGAIIRQSQFFDIASWAGLGTAVLVRLVSEKATGSLPVDSSDPRPTIGAVCVPFPGEDVCGDSWSSSTESGATTIMVADGLGHGPDAAEASVEAVRLFHRFQGHRVPVLLDYIHGGLRSSRGAAVSVARFEPAAGRIVFSGIGNVSGLIVVDGQIKRMVSMPGTAGHNARKIQAFDYPFRSGIVILYSDGLSTSWNFDKYSALLSRHPELIAAVLYRDFSRRRDDSTVVVARW